MYILFTFSQMMGPRLRDFKQPVLIHEEEQKFNTSAVSKVHVLSMRPYCFVEKSNLMSSK